MLRTAVMRRDHGMCRYCGAPAAEIDHMDPWARGGLTVLSNLAAACQRCNRSKGERTPEEWQRARLYAAALESSFGKPRRIIRRGSRAKPPPLAQLLRGARQYQS